MLKLTSPATVVTLAAFTALGPLATDMYLPAMPAMAEALNTGPDQVQLTLSFYMAGFALAQPSEATSGSPGLAACGDDGQSSAKPASTAIGLTYS